jgi:hypothetical protein
VASAAQYRVHRIAECAFEPVAIEFSVCLHVADGWLDCAAPACPNDTTFHPRAGDSHVVTPEADGGLSDAEIARKLKVSKQAVAARAMGEGWTRQHRKADPLFTYLASLHLPLL